jgi:cell division inhibitor SulA
MGGAAQVVMRVASQIWQVVFALQTLQVFCLALRKKAQYVVVIGWLQNPSFLLVI